MILTLQSVSRSFGAVTVADDVSFSVGQNEAVGIIGPNGAGKTSLFNLISGDLAPSSGSILFAGRDVTGLGARRRSHLGIARTYQVPLPFTGLTVLENVLVGAVFSAGAGDMTPEALADDVLRRCGLDHRRDLLAGSLSLLDRKRLELARALATGPEVLLLDEIAGGLSDGECVSLIAQINAIRAQGVSIVWIEHVVHALLAVADRLMVIDFGRKIAEGEPRAVFDSPEVQRIYMGIEA